MEKDCLLTDMTTELTSALSQPIFCSEGTSKQKSDSLAELICLTDRLVKMNYPQNLLNELNTRLLACSENSKSSWAHGLKVQPIQKMLTLSAMHGHAKTVFTLSTCKQDESFEETIGAAIKFAVLNGHESIVKDLLNSKMISPKDLTEAITFACLHNRAGILKLLVEASQIEYMNPDSIKEVIRKARENRNQEILRVLIETRPEFSDEAM